MELSIGQCSYGTKEITKLLPSESYDDVLDLMTVIKEQEYRKLLALCFNKKTDELKQMLKDLRIYNGKENNA